VLTLEDALQKMTSRPAEIFRLQGRGRIRQGYAADLVVFDPEAIQDRASYELPLEAPDGIAYVIVNGAIVSQANRVYNRFPGKVLRNTPEDPGLLAPLTPVLTTSVPETPSNPPTAQPPKETKKSVAAAKSHKQKQPSKVLKKGRRAKTGN
jgi:hypothetical protein